MATSIRACTVSKCDEASCAVCHCCQKDLCLDHLKEHRDRLNSQLNPFVNRINTCVQTLEYFDIKTSSGFATIEQWRTTAHQIINQFCDRLCQEFILQKKNEPLEKLHTARVKLDQLVRKQGATRENIRVLENELHAIEQQIDALQNIQINLRPLLIDENAVLQTNLQTRFDKNELGIERNFQIFVKLLTDRSISLMIKPSDTIEQIKRKIQDKEGIPVEQQDLTYMGKSFRNELTAAIYDLQPLCTISLRFFLTSQNNKKRDKKPMQKKGQTIADDEW